MGSSFITTVVDFSTGELSIVPADTIIHDSASHKPSGLPYSSVSTENSLQVMPQSANADTLLSPVRKEKLQLLYAKQDSLRKEALLNDLPVYARSQQSDEITSLVLPAGLPPSEKWTFGEVIPPTNPIKEAVIPGAGVHDWTILFWLFSLGILIWAKSSFSRHFSQIMLSLTDSTLSLNLFKDRNAFLQKIFSLLNLNFILVMGLFLFLMMSPLIISEDMVHHARVLLIACGIPTTLIIFRTFINKSLGYLFSRERVFSEYNHQILLGYKTLGIIMLPLVIL